MSATKIGFFDSGLGGLTILRAVRAQMPECDYIFYGDTKNIPYGDKSEDEILELTKNGVINLFEQGAILVIVACNTASAKSVRILQDTMLTGAYADRKILGVIIPTVETILVHGINQILLIGTIRTIASKKYETELSKISLRSIATPELAPLIEAGKIKEAKEILQKLLLTDKREGEVVVLGCTHYTVLKDYAREWGHTVLSQDEIIPEKLKDYLERHREIKSKLSQNSTVEIILSEENARYDMIKQDLFVV